MAKKIDSSWIDGEMATDAEVAAAIAAIKKGELETYTNATKPTASTKANVLIYVSDLDEIQFSNGTTWLTVSAPAGLSLTVEQINGTPVSVGSVNTIKFNNDTGFLVTDLGGGEVEINLGSTFKTWTVDGQDSLVAVGEDTVEFIAGTNITIETDNTANSKSITINATGSGSNETLTIGTGLTGTSYNGSAAVTVAIDSTVATLTGTQTLTNKTISGSDNTLSNIGNGSLTNSSITVNGTSISLGGSDTIKASTTNALTIGSGLSGSSFDGGSPVTIAVDTSTIATKSYVDDHINDSTAAHAASAVSVSATGNLASTDVQAALQELQGDINTINTSIGAANGIAPLNGSSKIDSTYLPSYVDDVLEYANLAALPATGETGKIYVTLDTNKTYRWSGSAYIEISPSEVNSVNGKTGIVSLSTTDISEGTNQYFTSQRAKDAVVSDTAYASSWNGVTDQAPSKNAVYDEIELAKTRLTSAESDIDSILANYIDVNANSMEQLTLTDGFNTLDLTATSIIGSGALTLDGTSIEAQAPLDMNNNAISGLPTPSTNSEPLIKGQVGVANGIAPLDATTKFDASYLPTAAATLTGSQTLTNKTFDDSITVKQVTTPSNPSSGYNKVYVKSDGIFYKLDSSGNETQLGASTTSGLAESGILTPSSYPLTLVSGDNGKVVNIDTSASRNVTLPTPQAGWKIILRDNTGKASTFPFTIVRSGSEKIQGVASDFVCRADYGVWTLISDGTDYFLI